MPINVQVKRTIEIAHDCQGTYDLVKDVKQSGECMSSVEEVVPLGDGKFEFILREQGLDGVKSMTFKGRYIAQYQFEPNVISWTSIGGNMSSSGRYEFEPTEKGVKIHAQLSNQLPISVPAIFRIPAELVVKHELLKTVVDMLKKVTLGDQQFQNTKADGEVSL
ncbi:hypothetical protein [Aquabacterium sp.]|uniref:hypothetical protein n=1 Tax=Aquabacterium sp. TaxID=1872578 RepID=UPI004037D1CB